MLKGDCIYITAKYFKKQDRPVQQPNRASALDCCYDLPVFWSDNSSSSTYKYEHDYSNWIVFCEKGIQSVVIKLIKNNTEIATLSDNTLGTFYPLGFITNRLGQQACGYLLDWNLVYDEYGKGSYMLKFEQTYSIGGAVNEYSFNGEIYWKLDRYSDYLADRTIRLEWFQNGQIGWFGNGRRVDFMGNNFYSQIRIPNSAFGFPKDDLEQEFTRDVDGNDLFYSRFIIDKYQIEIIQAPSIVHEYLKYTVRSAYFFRISDYNLNNTKDFKDVSVLFMNGADNQWSFYNNKGTVLYDIQEYNKNKIIYK